MLSVKVAGTMLLLAYFLVVRVWSTDGTPLTDPPPNRVCVLDAPRSDKLNYNFCGCRSDYIKSLYLTVSGFPFQQNTSKISASVSITPRKLLTGLRFRVENASVTFGDTELPLPGYDANICQLHHSRYFACPLAANARAFTKIGWDTRDYEEWRGVSSLRLTAKLLDLTNLEVLACLNMKIDLSS